MLGLLRERDTQTFHIHLEDVDLFDSFLRNPVVQRADRNGKLFPLAIRVEDRSPPRFALLWTSIKGDFTVPIGDGRIVCLNPGVHGGVHYQPREAIWIGLE